MQKVITISGAREAPRSMQSKMETLIITPGMVNSWKLPPFQRPLRVNDKVRIVTEQIKRDEVIEGVLTLGRLKGDTSTYTVDGQHRLEAFKLSDLAEVIADVRLCSFDSMAEMADEFVRLNSSLVRMRPDDILRGMESSLPALGVIRQKCPYVGYDQIRRSQNSPVVGMSSLLRCWTGAAMETPPSNGGAGQSAAALALNLNPQSLQNLLDFLETAHSAWGRDPEYYRLWGALNLMLCMWLWNKLVIDQDRPGNRRYVVLTPTQFKHCLMSVSANADYVAWLPGRNLNDRDRSPAYMRLKSIFTRRLRADSDGSTKISLPSPAWASG